MENTAIGMNTAGSKGWRGTGGPSSCRPAAAVTQLQQLERRGKKRPANAKGREQESKRRETRSERRSVDSQPSAIAAAG